MRNWVLSEIQEVYKDGKTPNKIHKIYCTVIWKWVTVRKKETYEVGPGDNTYPKVYEHSICVVRAMSELAAMATALDVSPHRHVLKYRTFLSNTLETDVALAAKSDMALDGT